MISFQNVTWSYQEDGEGKSLDSIHLEIKDGECILLCGKSGCGKTTMTRLLGGLIPNFYEGSLHGAVLLDGRNLCDLPMYEISKQVGSVFQNPRTQFYTVNTTSEIAFGCENLGMEPEMETPPRSAQRQDDSPMQNRCAMGESIAARVRQTARDLEIEALLDRNIFHLSGGEKQIIALASIYAMSPQVYVLDEPSSNLDVQAIEKLRKILTLLKQQGKTIIIAEHRTWFLKNLVDRAIYMEDGKIIREYTMAELAQFTIEEQLQSGIRTVDLLSYPITPCTAAPSDHTIKLQDIHCFYGKTEALSIPELSIHSGRITAIIGTNGAGKSTFVSCMCGLLKKVKGTFLLDGKKQTAKKRVRQSYLVMQETGHQLFSDSVREEIVLGNRDPSEKSLQEIMKTLDISDLADRHPMTLSGGQKQRVIIASACVCGKKILYFDEPTSGLDFSHMMETCQLLKQLQKEDVFLFIITHDYELIASVCDSVIHIENGRVQEQYLLNEAGIVKLRDFFSGCYS
ncbi:MAG: energy-coupling factor ABC transporter ATP-binding protein [Lachnospiraceae bacterium]|nr:energy-coupling factor ABC transporter ATP-binding protein [Lachnospiraceae bacterium]